MAPPSILKSPVALARIALIACAFQFSSIAWSEEQFARRPLLAKGDTWTYRTYTESASAGRQTATEQFTVTFVSDKVIIGTSNRIAGARQTESDWSWTPDLNFVTTTIVGVSSEGDKITYSPHRGTFRFPLRPGDTYQADYDLITGTRDYTRVAFKFNRIAKVVGWEDVAVPAGRFRTLLVEAKGTIRFVANGKSGPATDKLWYSPEVRAWVKFEVNNDGAKWQSELESYKLAE